MAGAVRSKILETLNGKQSRTDVHSSLTYCPTSRSEFGIFPSGGIGLLITLLAQVQHSKHFALRTSSLLQLSLES